MRFSGLSINIIVILPVSFFEVTEGITMDNLDEMKVLLREPS